MDTSSRPAQDAFQIGWICALPIEVAAAKQMLDEDFGILEAQDSTDTNSYHLGRVGKHYVTIAGLPAGQYGTTSATTVAINMMRTFSHSFRIGLMVGIGGGIPSAHHDVRLGDIVISYPSGTCGGVLQYDMGKVVEGGSLQRTGSLNSPPRSLLTALSGMRANEYSDDPLYPEYIEKAIGRNARTRRNFGRPDGSTDRLYQIVYEHDENAATCESCPPKWEVSRNVRDEAGPQVHYGIIASGNTVVKNAATRERLRQETEAICFEMEAAGLMMDFPCIVIRGICDYADSHKNKQWQGYAALAAASYAKELLSYVPVGQVSQEKLVTEICKDIIHELKEANMNIEKRFHQSEIHHRETMAKALTEEQQKCHQAFKTSNYEQFKDINPDRADGTCQWVLENRQYLDWLGTEKNDLLWISADPGCGKSVLTKSLIDVELQSLASTSICYFFFKDNEEQNNLATALCAVLHQLFGMQPLLLRHAIPSWQQNGAKMQGEANELWRILKAAISDPICSSIFCIFDALDECQHGDQESLMHKLGEFYTQSQSSAALKSQGWTKFLVTSRPYGEIQKGFLPATKPFPHIHVRGEEENERIGKEISLVIKIRVSELGKDISLTPEIQQRLEQQLLSMEHRTYLWLYLVIADIRLRFRYSLRPKEETIQLIPQSVNDAYKKILHRVPDEKKLDVKTILQIIIGARRPLTIDEMAMALGLATTSVSQTAATVALDSAGLDEKIRQLCGLFVFVKDSRIYLIHQTAREFLMTNVEGGKEQEWSFNSTSTEKLMSEICVSRLLMDDIDSEISGDADDKTSEDTDSVLNFLSYSAIYWPDHVRNMPSPADPKIETQIDLLYHITGKHFTRWYDLFRKKSSFNHLLHGFPPRNRVHAVHLAALNGHRDFIQKLISRGENNINQRDGEGRTALHWTSLMGHIDVVQLLLDNGADIQAQSGLYGTALLQASAGGHIEISQLLIDNGADIQARGALYGTALLQASAGGHIEIAQLLLDNGADIQAQSGYYGTALQEASAEGRIEIVQLLLDHGADIQAQGEPYGTALQQASARGRIEIVQLLLDHGADIQAQGEYYGTALQQASAEGHIEIVKLLIDNGADIQARSRLYGTALQRASAGGHIEIIQLLLDNGADIQAHGEYYGMALQQASAGGHIEIVQLLLDYRADIQAQGEHYSRALQQASAEGHIEIVQLLLDHGADIQAQGEYYGTALQQASAEGHIEIVKLLIDNGADIQAQSRLYGTALLQASARGRIEIIQLLLDNGADIQAQGEHFGTALQQASAEGHIEIVKLLIDNGADIQAQSGYFGTALQGASARGRIEIVQLLLDNGADIQA